ncbi:hypothetical protein, partial [Anaeromyxobacter sp. PSR-1]|uniref:hypothetical protein n=1 Tax=Anaeromyxobacter sp. PSR-1 TaxID=1300915 RepID=UPI001269F69B
MLLGEPGIGKSHEMRVLVRQAGREAFSEDLGKFTSDLSLIHHVFESDVVKRWIRGDSELTMFLDGLDECRLRIKTIARILSDRLQQLPRERLKFRIASRVADWPEYLSEALRTLWGEEQPQEFILAPLLRSDVELAAEQAGIRPDDFIRAVARRKQQAFASRPLTLKFLLSQYNGELSASAAELYEAGCLRLASETNPERRSSDAVGALSEHQRLEVAEVLAASCIVSGWSEIAVGAHGASERAAEALDTDTLVAAAARATERGVRGVTISRGHIEEALNTGLFTGGTGGHVRWSHWTYSEYLAARFLANHLSSEQLASLVLRAGTDGRLRAVPQFREVTAWLTTLVPRLRDVVVRNDPNALLSSGVGLDAAVRVDAVDSLLRLFESESEFDSDPQARRRYDLLDNPELDRQLLPFITDRSKSKIARRAAIEIAAACRVMPLLPRIVEVACDTSDDAHLRAKAASAVRQFGTHDAKLALQGLAVTTREEDPSDQIRGETLRMLAAEGLLHEDLWRYCTQPHDAHHHGAYSEFLMSDVPRLLSDRRVTKAGLRWAREVSASGNAGGIELARLHEKVLFAGWEQADDPEVLGELASTVCHRAARYESPLGEFDGELAKHPARREKLLEATVARAALGQATGIDLLFKAYPLLEGQTFASLVERAKGTSGQKEARVWALLARFKLDGTDETFLLALDAVPHVPELQAEMGAMFRAVDLDSEEARVLRDLHRSTHDTRDGRMPRSRRRPSAADVPPLLDLLDSGDADAWWRLNAMMLASAEYHIDLSVGDLTRLPAWRDLSTADKLRVTRAARHYIRVGEPRDHEWLGVHNLHHHAAASAYRALLLLYNADQTSFSEVSEPEWHRWAPAALTYGISDSEGMGRTAILGRAMAALGARAVGVLQALTIVQGRYYPGSLRLLLEKAEASVARELFEWALKLPLDPDPLYSVLVASLPRCSDDSVALACVLDGRLPPAKRAAVSLALLQTSPPNAWQRIAPLLKTDPSLEQEVAKRLRFLDEPEFHSLLSSLDEGMVADLYEWLDGRVPANTATPSDEGMAEADELAIARSTVLTHLTERGTERAVASLQAISTKHPSNLNLRFIVTRAEEARLRRGWTPVTPAQLMDLCASHERRLVETDQELVEVISKSLLRLEHRLQGAPPAYEDLWDGDRPKPEDRVSDYVKRHLADDLVSRGIVVNREVEIRPGSETDLRVEVLATRSGSRPLHVTIETKGCWHPELQT